MTIRLLLARVILVGAIISSTDFLWTSTARCNANADQFFFRKNDDDDRKGVVVNISCVGDSITSYGCASAPSKTYVAQLQQILGEDGFSVANHGASGHTMLKNGHCASNATDCGGDCSYWHSQEFQEALASRPGIVTIMLGTNDAKGCNWYGPPNGSPRGLGVEFRSAYLDMVSRFKSLPSEPRVYLLVPPPLVNPPNHPDNPPPYDMKKEVINKVFPDMIASIARETEADGVIDIWTALGGETGYQHDDMTCDGCHPRDKAMTIIAEMIARAIGTTAATTEKYDDVVL